MQLEDERRKGEDRVQQAHPQGVDERARDPGNDTDQPANRGAENDDDEPGDKRDLGALVEPCEDVAPVAVGSHGMAPRGRLQCILHIDRERILPPGERTNHRKPDEDQHDRGCHGERRVASDEQRRPACAGQKPPAVTRRGRTRTGDSYGGRGDGRTRYRNISRGSRHRADGG